MASTWAVAAGFGLLHGLGFAGALAAVGLPTAEIPLALFSFNAGIELGQLAFVTSSRRSWMVMRRWPARRSFGTRARSPAGCSWWCA